MCRIRVYLSIGIFVINGVIDDPAVWNIKILTGTIKRLYVEIIAFITEKDIYIMFLCKSFLIVGKCLKIDCTCADKLLICCTAILCTRFGFMVYSLSYDLSFDY